MSNKTRSDLKALWITGYKPTQTDYGNFFDSFYNILDDSITGGLTYSSSTNGIGYFNTSTSLTSSNNLTFDSNNLILTGNLSVSGLATHSNTLSMGSNKILNVATGSSALDAVNTGQLSNIKHGSFGITIDGQGSVITTGSAGFLVMPYSGTITKWYVVGDQSGSVQIDLKRSSTSIIGAGNKPTLSSTQRANATVSSWTSTSIAIGDEIEFNVDSATTITRVQLFIFINKD